MHFSNEESRKKSQERIAQKTSEIESLVGNMQQNRERIQILSEEILKEGVELIKVSDKLTDISSILHADQRLKKPLVEKPFQNKEPVSIRKDLFPYDPQLYITGSYRKADFSQKENPIKVNTEPFIYESLGSRKKGNRKKSSVKSSNKKKRTSLNLILSLLLFILLLLILFFVLDIYNPHVLSFLDSEKAWSNLLNTFNHK
ncbi:MAG: hypothetical protein K0R18_2700 [Bacillales bacterium]|jgi:hypothetical protein|nr:hypothetical protein [Bacillales bacterium]